MALTKEEKQDICDRIQLKETHEDWFPISNREHKGKWYYHIISIEGELYGVRTDRKILFIDEM